MNPVRTTAEKAFQREIAREMREMMRRSDRIARRVACQQCHRELRRGPRNTGDFGDGSGDYVGDRLPRPIQDRERIPLQITGSGIGGYRIAN